MRILVLLVLVLSATRLCVAAPAVTNSISSAVLSVTAATNAPATKVSRQQCEAVTKSGNRCKRNAVVGGKLCRQHQKIADVKSGKK